MTARETVLAMFSAAALLGAVIGLGLTAALTHGQKDTMTYRTKIIIGITVGVLLLGGAGYVIIAYNILEG